LLLEAARLLERVDASQARATYLQALSAAMFAGQLARDGELVMISQAALAGPPLPFAPKPSDLLLQGLALRYTKGLAAGAPLLEKAVRAFRQATDMPPDEARWLWLASNVALYLWDDDGWDALLTQELTRIRAAGALTALPTALSSRICYFANHGRLDEAALLETELHAVTEATGIAMDAYAPLMLAAVRGRESEFRQVAGAIVGDAEGRGEGRALTVNAFLSGWLYNGLGDYPAALSAASKIESFPEEGPVAWAHSELVEAAVRVGEVERARHSLEVVATTAQATKTDWGLGIEARCRALVSDDDVAESFYLEAIELLARCQIRVQYARAHLVYGEWLRRQRRRADARKHLRVAYEMFGQSGVEAFADRAARELRATGEHTDKRAVVGSLTPQELQIARLARDGFSNSEIGSRLFISRYTVEYHLKKVFLKLGINSRTKLTQTLPPDPGAVPLA
jgi:DNA-binding NarL/FixJ family response regulator